MNKLKLFLIAWLIAQFGFSQGFIQTDFAGPTCFGMCDGSVVFSTTMTTGPFTAVITNSSTCPNSTVQSSSGNSITLSGLCSCDANYTVSIYNSLSVLVGYELLQVPVTTTAQLILNTPTVNPAVCSTCCNGSVFIEWSGGFAPTANDATVTIDGLDVGGIYFPNPTVCVGQHTVCVTDLANCVVCTTFSMNDVPIAGLRENASPEQISLSPNPAFNQIKISIMSFGELGAVHCFDLNGKLVLESAEVEGINNEIVLDVVSLKPGVYFIEVLDKNNALIGRKKLMKIQQ